MDKITFLKEIFLLENQALKKVKDSENFISSIKTLFTEKKIKKIDYESSKQLWSFRNSLHNGNMEYETVPQIYENSLIRLKKVIDNIPA